MNPGAAEICGNNTDDNCNGSTDEGCVVCATSATITPSNFIIICGNQTVTLNASFNGTTDSIRWFKGANPIAGATGNTFSVNKWSVGMYILTGYCNGVPVRDTIMINDFKIGTPGDSTKICTYGLTVLSAPFLAGASYSWRLGSLNGPVVGSNDTLHITGYNGVIWCKITAAGGCSKFAKVKLLPSNFCGSAGKMDLELNESLLIYPNPARDYFRLLFLNEAQELPDWSEWMLLNTNGGVVWQKEIRKEDRKEGIEIDVSQLPSGIYFLRMKGSDLSRRLLISK